MAGFDMMALMNDKSKAQAAGAGKYELQKIPLAKLNPNPANEKIYEVGDVEELAQSILLAGKILQNVVVTVADENGNHTIIAGHRRRLACQKLVEDGHEEFSELPCMVMTEPDDLMQELVLIQTNSTARVLSEAEKMRQAERATAILTELKSRKQISGRVRDIVAKMLGATTGQLGRYSVISKGLTNETLRGAFERGDIGVSVAYEAARLDEEGQAHIAKKVAKVGVASIRDMVEWQKQREIEQAAEEADDGLPMEKEYEVKIKPKFKATLTIDYVERDGKFYAGFIYNVPKGGGASPISDTPYDSSQLAIEAAIKRAAERSEYLHKALWESGFAIVGKPEEAEPEAPKPHTEYLDTIYPVWITTQKEGREYKCSIGYTDAVGKSTERCIGHYPDKKSCKGAAMGIIPREAPKEIVEELVKKGYASSGFMSERFPEVGNRAEEQATEKEKTKVEAARAKMGKEGYNALTDCEKCKITTGCEDCCRTCPPEKHCNVRQCHIDGEKEKEQEARRQEERIAELKSERESKSQEDMHELWFMKKAMESVIRELNIKSDYKVKEADIYANEGNGLKENISRKAADLFARMADSMEQEMESISEQVAEWEEEFEQEAGEE